MSTHIHENRTPNDNPFKLECREGTNDANTTNWVSKLDEYGLRGMKLEGWALDIGAYIGAVAIPLAIDHPNLRVVAVEPVPENVTLLYRNIALNDVSFRVSVCSLAAAAPGVDLAPVRYGGKGAHRYVGNADEVAATADVFDAPTVSLTSLLLTLSINEVALMKIDCEGCEWGFLTDPAVAKVQRIVGEYHGVPRTDLLPDHEVHFDDNYHFWAVRL